MLQLNFKTAALVLAAPSLALAAPANAAPPAHAPAHGWHVNHGGDTTYEHRRKRHRHDRYERYDRYDRYDDYGNYDRGGRYYDEPVYRNTQVWRGRDGRYYCRKSNGTTGLLIGGAAGALLGREIAGRRGDRTLGAILGAAGGALLGREIDRGGSRCR